MARGRGKEFFCSVVSEMVLIRLKRPGGFGRPQGYFVQCDQSDCQYVDENKPPVPCTSACSRTRSARPRRRARSGARRPERGGGQRAAGGWSTSVVSVAR